MKALLDTCILSELRHSRSAALLIKTLDLFASDDLFISVISIGEISKGVALLPPSKKKTDIQQWALQLEKNFSDRLLNVNCETVHIWGELTAKAQKKGKIIPATDGLIAATAMAHGLHIITRNVADFEPTGVFIINPWAEKS